MTNFIPQTDPRANYLAHAGEIDAAIAATLQAGHYILGQQTKAFEEEFAAYLGIKHAIGVGSGTEALHIALRACGIGAGDGVVTVSHTAVATVAAIELAGAIPLFADIDPDYFILDCERLDGALSRHTGPKPKAVIAVHLYGHPVDMPALMEVAARHDLIVIEDCAQSHGAVVGGRKTGTWGQAAAFSFYPTKNLGALGDGGAVVTRDPALAERIRMLREYGWRERYISDIPGMNTRLDELQAAVLRVKLRHLDADNARRQRIASAYRAGLAGAAVQLPPVRTGIHHAYHQFVVRFGERDALRERLRAAEIGTLVHYPAPVHLQPAYKGRIAALGALSATEQAARTVLSLPMFPELHPDQVERVIKAIENAT